MIKKFSILIVSVILLSSCAQIEHLPYKAPTTKHIFSKNYEIGKLKTIYIGEEIIKVKDYNVIKRNINKAEVQNDFIITGPFVSCSGSKGEKYNIIGVSNGFYMIQFPGCQHFRWGIDKNGYLSDYLVGPDNTVRSTLLFRYDPPDIKFKSLEEEKVDIDSGFVNFEIIYTGITGQAINLLYREYTPDNIARAAFYQNLTYPIDSKFIRFKKIKLQLHEITNESIAYTVLEDGLKK